MTFPEPGPRAAGHTRWGRLGLVMVPTLVVSALLLVGIGSGILPVSLAVSAQSVVISGQNLKISADRLEGTGCAELSREGVAGDINIAAAVQNDRPGGVIAQRPEKSGVS